MSEMSFVLSDASWHHAVIAGLAVLVMAAGYLIGNRM